MLCLTVATVASITIGAHYFVARRAQRSHRDASINPSLFTATNHCICYDLHPSQLGSWSAAALPVPPSIETPPVTGQRKMGFFLSDMGSRFACPFAVRRCACKLPLPAPHIGQGLVDMFGPRRIWNQSLVLHFLVHIQNGKSSSACPLTTPGFGAGV